MQLALDEIRKDKALQYFGAALALTNGLSAIFWLIDLPIGRVLHPDSIPVCWPIFPACDRFRVLPPQLIFAVVWGLLLGSIYTATLFCSQNKSDRAFWLLLALTTVKYALIIQDFRLTLNHHYMAGWMAAVYFLAVNKRQTLVGMLIALYFCAGMLKIDPASEWISSATFYGRLPLGVPQSLILTARAYVVVLELVVVFGLLSRRPLIFWSTLTQLIIFHVVSFGVVGWFYPALMFMLLSVIPLARVVPPPSLLWPQYRSALARWSPLLWIALFSCLQLPQYVLPGASALTGEGRLFALSMFDAPVSCRAELIRSHDSIPQTTPLRPAHLNARTMCDPLVYFEYSRHLCSRGFLTGETVRLRLDSKRGNDEKFTTVVDIDDVCGVERHYSIFRHNEWIVPVP